MALTDLQRELEKGALRPAYLLVGPEEMEKQEALELLRARSLQPESLSFNYAELSVPEARMQRVIEAARILPMMSPRRMVVVRNVDALKEGEREELFDYLGRPSRTTVLVLVCADMDRRTNLFKTLRDLTFLVEFPRLKEAALERWTEQAFRSRSLGIRSVSLHKLIDLVGSDLHCLKNEIDKIALYCLDRKTVPDEAVETLVRSSRQRNVFELTEALGKRDRIRALRLLGKLFEAGDSPIMIVNLCTRHFRQILIAKDLLRRNAPRAEISSQAQVPPWVMPDFLEQVRAIDQVAAEAVFMRLAVSDLKFKSSGVDERLYLESLICTL